MKNVSEILAFNLARLMAAHKSELGSQPKIAGKTKIGQRTVGRALKGEGSARLDTLEAIARAFKLNAWELLHPELSSRLPTRSKAEEPFALYSVDPGKQSVVLDMFDQLTRAQQEQFIAELRATVEANQVVIREVGPHLRLHSDADVAKHLPPLPINKK